MSLLRSGSWILPLLLLCACSRSDDFRSADFQVSDQQIVKGETTRLSWDVPGAQQLRLEPGLGLLPARGSLLVSPEAPTVYRLQDASGATLRELKVRVYDFSALTATLDGYLDALGNAPEGSRGYVFALAIDGKQLLLRAGGDFTPESRVAIASATKAPTAAAILALAQEGRLDLDRPIAAYIPDIWPGDGDKAAVTTRMLLNHSSGLPASSPCLDDMDSQTLEQCATEIAAMPLEFAPGTRFHYGAASYQLAGLVATRLSGLPWKEFFASRIAAPLGLRDYEYLGNGNPRLAGGAISDAADYLRIEQMLLDGGLAADGRRVLSPGLTVMLRQDQIAGLPVDSSPVPAGAGLQRYSFGWWISDPANHPGSAGPELSDPGMFGSVPWLDDDRKYAAVLLISATTQTGLDIWSAARARILEQIAAQE